MAVATKEKKPLSEAQKAHLARLTERNRAAASAAKPPAVEGEALDSEESILAGLQTAMGALQDKKRASQALVEVGRLLDGIDFGAYPDLVKDPAINRLIETVNEKRVESAKVPPGTAIGKGLFIEEKKGWSMADLKEGNVPVPGTQPVEHVVWTPFIDGPFIWNGVKLNAQRYVEIRTAKCFKDVHDEAVKGMRVAEQNAKFMFRQGGIPEDPTVLGRPEDGLPSAKVRGMAHGVPIISGAGTQWDADTYLSKLDGQMNGDEGEPGDEGEE